MPKNSTCFASKEYSFPIVSYRALNTAYYLIKICKVGSPFPKFQYLCTQMRRILLILGILLATNTMQAQEEDYANMASKLPSARKAFVLYRYPNPTIEDGDTIWTYLLPEYYMYAPLRFKDKKALQKYNKLVYNVKKVLPLAHKVNEMINETYLTLEQLPDKKSKDELIKNVEKEIKQRYTPEMKKLTYSQGKLLIKLVDRECNQSSYEIVKAFFGNAKAAFYQVFAWTFHASLKKEYKPESDDRLIERVVVQIEQGEI